MIILAIWTIILAFVLWRLHKTNGDFMGAEARKIDWNGEDIY
jgi:hypothetical protein